MNILGICEMRWTDLGLAKLGSEENVVCCGRSDDLRQEGIGYIVVKKARKSLLEWEKVISRIKTAKFFCRQNNTTMLQWDITTEHLIDKDNSTRSTRLHRMPFRIVDFNAKIVTHYQGYELCLGSEGLERRTTTVKDSKTFAQKMAR